MTSGNRSTAAGSYTPETDDEVVREFAREFAYVAGLQGRLAYLVMSAHAIQPHILNAYMGISMTRVLYVNMLYGIGIMIYGRPNMQPIGVVNRIAFSCLGSAMFCYASTAFFNWLRNTYASCAPYTTMLFSLLAGRLFMLHLQAFLYHVDTRAQPNLPRNAAFDSMFNTTPR